MKLIRLSIFLLLLTNEVKSQSVDTVAVLQNIITNKSNYIGQPFSVLLAQMPLTIRYFTPSMGSAKKTNDELYTNISFYFPLNIDELYLTKPSIMIVWQIPQNRGASRTLFKQNDGAWSTSVANHYGSAIIKDIFLELRYESASKTR